MTDYNLCGKGRPRSSKMMCMWCYGCHLACLALLLFNVWHWKLGMGLGTRLTAYQCLSREVGYQASPPPSPLFSCMLKRSCSLGTRLRMCWLKSIAEADQGFEATLFCVLQSPMHVSYYLIYVNFLNVFYDARINSVYQTRFPYIIQWQGLVQGWKASSIQFWYLPFCDFFCACSHKLWHWKML